MPIEEELIDKKVIKVYMDTNIIMGLVRKNFSKKIIDAMDKILKLRKEGQIQIYVSDIVNSEIKEIPKKYVYYHRLIYDLIDNIAIRPKHFYWIHHSKLGPNMGGVAWAPRGFAEKIKDRLISKLEDIIPKKRNPKKNQARLRDIEHLYQCKKNNIDLFWTEDKKTIIRYALKLKDLGIDVVNTINLLSHLEELTE